MQQELPDQQRGWPLLTEEFRYRIQMFEGGTGPGWRWESFLVYDLEELSAIGRTQAHYDRRAVKISWANPWVVHSVLWVKNGST